MKAVSSTGPAETNRRDELFWALSEEVVWGCVWLHFVEGGCVGQTECTLSMREALVNTSDTNGDF